MDTQDVLSRVTSFGTGIGTAGKTFWEPLSGAVSAVWDRSISWILRFALFVAYLLVILVLYNTTITTDRFEDDFLWWGPAPSTSIIPSPAPVTTPPVDSQTSTGWGDVIGSFAELIPWSISEAQSGLKGFVRFPANRSIALVFFVLCGAPYLLTFWTSFLIRRRANRLDATNLSMPAWLNDSTEDEWFDVADRVKEQWNSAKVQKRLTYDRAQDYAHLYGFLATATLAASLIVLRHAPGNAFEPFPKSTRIPYHNMVPLAVAVAAAVSFTLEFGKLVVRLAGNDSGAKMYAAALRTLLAVVVVALFLPLALSTAGEDKLASSAMGVAVIAAAIGLLGRRMLDVATARAESVLHVDNVTTKDRADLNLIEGINDDDINRLAEEGVDSVHALAFVSTAKLFFNSIYGLSRICNWQDQALLFEYLGQSRAKSWGDNLGIEGAIAAQTLAVAMLRPDAAPATIPECTGPLKKLEDADRQVIYKGMGFATDQAANVKLQELLCSHVIKLLRIYSVAGVQSQLKPGIVADPNKGRYGGNPVANGLELSASIEKLADGYSRVKLKIEPRDTSQRPLTGPVDFYLAPDHQPTKITATPVNNVATYEVVSRTAFTVGVVTDGGKTRLELDLNDVAGAPAEFYTRNKARL